MKIQVLDHPVIQHNLSVARERATDCDTFASCIEQMASLMVYEVTRNLPVDDCAVQTPLEATTGQRMAGRTVLVPILRAGLGMVQGFKRLLPAAMVAHLGLYRDEESLLPVVYYKKLPHDLEGRTLIVLDPMLATGGTADAAIRFLKELQPASIALVSILAAPEGVELVHRNHPDVPMYTAALDRELNERGYILPGLGDAGDRIFGTLPEEDAS